MTDVKTYCGTKEDILAQLRKDLDFRPLDDRYSYEVAYPFNSDGLSGMDFAGQLEEAEARDGRGMVAWLCFRKTGPVEVMGTICHAKVRILGGKS